MERQSGHVNQNTYNQACNMLYTPYGETSQLRGKDRQEVQQIKHANDAKQISYNPYAGPVDYSQRAQDFMNNMSSKY